MFWRSGDRQFHFSFGCHAHVFFGTFTFYNTLTFCLEKRARTHIWDYIWQLQFTVIFMSSFLYSRSPLRCEYCIILDFGSLADSFKWFCNFLVLISLSLRTSIPDKTKLDNNRVVRDHISFSSFCTSRRRVIKVPGLRVDDLSLHEIFGHALQKTPNREEISAN